MAKGWIEKLAENSDEHTSAPDSTIKARVSGPDPGYTATSTCLVQAAMTILKESEKMPKGGGVLSPGVSFKNTSIVSLAKHGVNFEMLGN